MKSITSRLAPLARLIILVDSTKCFALIVIVGRKSANGLPSGTPSASFICCVVFPPNSARSPLLRMRPKLSLSPSFSKMSCDSSFSLVVSFLRALIRSPSARRCSISSACLVRTAKYVCANAISSWEYIYPQDDHPGQNTTTLVFRSKTRVDCFGVRRWGSRTCQDADSSLRGWDFRRPNDQGYTWTG